MRITNILCRWVFVVVLWMAMKCSFVYAQQDFMLDPDTEPPLRQEVIQRSQEPKQAKDTGKNQNKDRAKDARQQATKAKTPDPSRTHRNLFLLGVGYSSSEGFLGLVHLKSQDMFGVEGLRLSLDSRISQMGLQAESFLVYDSSRRPWLIDMKLHARQNTLGQWGGDDQPRMLDIGGRIRLGWKWGQGWRILAGYRLAHQRIEQPGLLETSSFSAPVRGWRQPALLSAVQLQLEYKTPQNPKEPSDFHKGIDFSLLAEASSPAIGSSYRYANMHLRFRYGVPLPWGLHLALETQAGMLIGEEQHIPFTERYRLGGGYTSMTMPLLGPQFSNGQSVLVGGGQGMLYSRAVLYAPLIRAVGLYLFAGIEAGVLLYRATAPCDSLWQVSWNASVLAGLQWNSPIGPLTFGFGVPLIRSPGMGSTIPFTFGLGGRF